jgi:L-idonate 5-dehydrogenase
MKACIIRQARELAVEEVAEPSPAAHEVVIQLGAGGICGSDLHYFAEGGVGDFKLREPMILGHESAGTVARVGAEVKAVRVGDRVAVDPSQPCGHCAACQSGRRNLCPNVRFFGSAARYPHVQGIFAEFFTIPAENCHVIPDHLSFRAAACAEPLAVGLHAVGQAGAVRGRSVLVVGSGPIGVLLAAAAKLGGAERICVIDLLDEPLAIARAMGATETINAKTEPERIAASGAKRGTFDVGLEASGSAAGLANALELTRPGGTIVQVGNYPRGEVSAPLNRIIAKELQFHGSFRFDREYAAAVHALTSGRIDVAPLLTHEFTFREVQQAFLTAADRRRAMKVSLRPA